MHKFLLSTLVMVGFLFTLGCTPGMAESPDGPASLPGSNGVESKRVAQTETKAPQAAPATCAAPTPAIAEACAATEQQILSATVRLVLHGPRGGLGHATVIAGRYLLTHNHFPVTAEELRRGGDNGVSALSVHKVNGDVVLRRAPLSFFTVAAEAPETLLLDFKEYGGVGFFDSVGVPSATTTTMAPELLQPGLVVAQIDWDGSKTYVRWVTIADVPEEGVPSIELEGPLTPGASGGGVFWQGDHIANNWQHLTDRNPDSGMILRDYSVAALNTLTPATG